MEFDFNELFNDSYEFVLNNSDEFFDRFITTFINSSPLIKEAFRNTDMDNQKSMLKKAITHMVIFFTTKRASPYLIAISKAHINTHNIAPHLYENFINTLISTLDEIEPHFSNETAVAWRITLAPGIEFMKHMSLKEVKVENKSAANL